MNKAFAIKFKDGGFIGRGYAHGVGLFLADLYQTREEAAKVRTCLLSGWDEIKHAEIVEIGVISEGLR